MDIRVRPAGVLIENGKILVVKQRVTEKDRSHKLPIGYEFSQAAAS